MNILIIDFFNLIKRYTFLLEEVPNEGEFYSDITTKIINKISNSIDTYKIDLFFICSDSGFNKRANSILGGTYKANRNRVKSLTQEEKEKDYIDKLKKILLTLPNIFIEVLDVEADNIIYFVSNYIRNKIKDYNIYIATSDSDFLQLIDNNTNILDWSKGLITIDNWKETHKLENKYIKPKDYALLKSIVGDNSDNIKGIPGVGWKTALKLLDFLYLKLNKKLDINNINDIISYLKEISSSFNINVKEKKLVDKFLNIFNSNTDLIKKNYSVISLDMLETPYIVKIMNILESSLKSNIKFKQKEFFELLKFDEKFKIDLYYEEIKKKNIKSCYNFKMLAIKSEKKRQQFFI